jgi:hypothetical protein
MKFANAAGLYQLKHTPILRMVNGFTTGNPNQNHLTNDDCNSSDWYIKLQFLPHRKP